MKKNFLLLPDKLTKQERNDLQYMIKLLKDNSFDSLSEYIIGDYSYKMKFEYNTNLLGVIDEYVSVYIIKDDVIIARCIFNNIFFYNEILKYLRDEYLNHEKDLHDKEKSVINKSEIYDNTKKEATIISERNNKATVEVILHDMNTKNRNGRYYASSDLMPELKSPK